MARNQVEIVDLSTFFDVSIRIVADQLNVLRCLEVPEDRTLSYVFISNGKADQETDEVTESTLKQGEQQRLLELLDLREELCKEWIDFILCDLLVTFELEIVLNGFPDRLCKSIGPL